METSVNMFGNSESPRSQTRLQRQAPTALHLDRIPDNPFLHQSCDDAVATTAIPLLSPIVSKSALSLSRQGHDFMFLAASTEKNGSQPSMDNKEGWQKVDRSNQLALLNMFQAKFVLVDQ